jgi:hypothetical protein
MIVLTTRRPEINSRVETEGTYTAITLATFKKHLKWDPTDISEDALMQIYLTSTIRQAEMYTRRVIDVASWITYLDSFYDFTFDVSPIDVSSVVVKYTDVNNAEQTLATSFYTVKNKGADAYAELEFESGLPELYDMHEPVRIEFDAGYSTYPSDLQGIILQEAATRFENRTNEMSGSLGQITFGFHQRLFPYKML